MLVSKFLFTLLARRDSSSVRRLTTFLIVPYRYRPQAIKEAQQAMTDYLHATRSVPYVFADEISRNAEVSLSNVVSNIRFSTTHYAMSIKKLLRYHPINEFEFFYESIGIDYHEVCGFLPGNKFFISEDESVLNVACVLYAFGFPWNKLGKFYKEDSSIFTKNSDELRSRLSGFKDYGFDNTSIIGICLAFPCLLCSESGLETGALLDSLKKVFVDFDLGSCIAKNVDAWFEVCQKIKLFYDLGCEKGKVGELMGKNKSIFIDVPLEVLVQRLDYFCRFDITRKEAGFLLLQRPEVLKLDLETPILSVVGLLKHFELGVEELGSVARKYPHVLGRNKMVNLPHLMRAMDLHLWFLTKLRDGSPQLLASYAMSTPDEDIDQEFRDGLERIKVSDYRIHTARKLDFLHRIGFGENAMTLKLLNHLHGGWDELQKRFDCLLHAGIPFSKLCVMMRVSPAILHQRAEILEQKVNYLCQDMGCSITELDNFPSFLTFNLENRIKPRFQFKMWLAEKGCTNKYNLATFIASNEKIFVARVRAIHPAAPKYWLQFSSYKNTGHK